jgi:hypothetical protein
VVNRANGWLVAITVAGKRYHRYFGDSTFGSENDARAAAEELAARDLELHAELRALRIRFAVRSTSRSGWTGVTRLDETSRRCAGWLAYWDDPLTGKRVSKKFSVKRFGEDEACLLAMQLRQEAMQPYRARYEELIAVIEASMTKFPTSKARHA